MTEAHLRGFFDARLAAPATAIQRDVRHGVRALMPGARAANDRVKSRFMAELVRPAVEHLRPEWTFDEESSLTQDELFASKLFQRIPLTRFTATSRFRGRVHELPFEMHEVIATGDGPREFARILLIGFLAHVRLPVALPGHLRFCRQTDKTWRRPAMDGYRAIETIPSSLKAHSHVDATPDAVPLSAIPGLVQAIDDCATRGWLVHVALGGLSAWIAIERSRAWFEPRVLPPHSADDLIELERTFTIIEDIAQQIRAIALVTR